MSLKLLTDLITVRVDDDTRTDEWNSNIIGQVEGVSPGKSSHQ